MICLRPEEGKKEEVEGREKQELEIWCGKPSSDHNHPLCLHVPSPNCLGFGTILPSLNPLCLPKPLLHSLLI